MQRVLILCTGNSCRSQMAEGWFRYFTSQENVSVFSAGTHPESVNKYAIRVMNLYGIDISKHISSHLDDYKNISFDYVITLCDNAKENCPVFHSAKIIHESFPDPAEAVGTEEELVKVYSKVCIDLKAFIYNFIIKNIQSNNKISS